MFDVDPLYEQLSVAEILDRLADVSAMLHHEQGNRDELLMERAQLLELARRTGIIHGRRTP